MTLKAFFTASMLILLAAGVSLAGVGDRIRVTLKNGTSYTGTITKETSKTIVIETLVHNIPFKRTVARRNITESVALDAPAHPQGTKKKASDLKQPTPAEHNEREKNSHTLATRYMVIPIHEAIGLEDVNAPALTVTAMGIESALQYAKRKRIEHIVFSLDTPGGFLREEIGRAHV